MRVGPEGELVFESTTEARIASELLIRATGRDILSEIGIEPPVKEPRIGVVDAINRRIEDKCGTSHPQEYTMTDPQAGERVVQLLGVASMPRNIIFPPRYTRPFRRTSYMARHVRDYYRTQHTDQF
jgi:hypothetical protein